MRFGTLLIANRGASAPRGVSFFLEQALGGGRLLQAALRSAAQLLRLGTAGFRDPCRRGPLPPDLVHAPGVAH